MGSFLRGATGTGNSYAAQPANITNQNFQPGIGQSANQFNQTFQNQGSLANALLAQSQGQGPNPAQIMLQQGTENAIKQNTGMLASQRGISPALAARQAAEGAAAQTQQAAGQGALMGAQQQMSAQGALSNLYGQQQQGALGMQSTLQNAQAAQNNANVGMTSNMNNVNAGVASQNAATAGDLAGGLMSGVSSAIGGLFNKGGTVPRGYAGGGQVDSWGYNDQPPVDNNASLGMMAKYIDSGGQSLKGGVSSFFPGASKEAPTTTGQASPWEQGGGMAGGPGDVMSNAAPASAGGGMAGDALMLAAARGGTIPAHFHHIANIYHGGGMAARGGQVPGKAPVPGPVDTPKNDVVPTMLSPGEVVIPKHITEGQNPVEDGANFLASELKKHGKGGNEHGDFHEALKRAIVSRGKK